MKNLKRNFHIFCIAVAIVLVWRGVWGLSDLYLFPDNPTLSFVISTIVGLAILYMKDHKLNELL